MFPTHRSRRRPRYGVCLSTAVISLLLLLSVSVLYNRLTFSTSNPVDDRSTSKDDGVWIRNTLVSDSDDVVGSSNEDMIDELDILVDRQQESKYDSTLDTEDDGYQNSSNPVSSSGLYFDHVSSSIRRTVNKRSFDEWDDDYVGFNVGLGVEDKSKVAFGSDDVPVDQDVRKRMVQVKGIEDALMLKVGKRVSPLREGWGEWFDKKADFLRRDKMFKSNFESLNPMNNPLLQDPDGVGVTTLTRGDKVVQKWWLNEFKRVPFGNEKTLSDSKGSERRYFEGNGNEGAEITTNLPSRILEMNDEVNVKENRKVKMSRRNLNENEGSGLKSTEAKKKYKHLPWQSNGGLADKIDRMHDDGSSKKLDNGDQDSSSNGIELVADTSVGAYREKSRLKDGNSHAYQGKSKFAGHVYADGRRWGYYPGLNPDLSFTDFMKAFFKKGKCDVSIYMVWNSPSWMYNVRHKRGLESILFHHPNACVVVFSETIELDFFKESFVKDGYKVAVAMPNLDELLKHTPTHKFVSVWFKWRKTKFYSVHYSELVRLVALYKYGGVYLDSDVIVLKPLSSLNNTVGLEDQHGGSSLNGAVMAFKKHSPFILECLKEFYMTYDDTRLRWNGADLLTRVAKRFLRKGSKSTGQVDLKVQPSYVFFPISSQLITRYFKRPATQSEKAEQDDKFNKIGTESVTFHFWSSLTSSLIPEPESLVSKLINRHCIHCSDML